MRHIILVLSSFLVIGVSPLLPDARGDESCALSPSCSNNGLPGPDCLCQCTFTISGLQPNKPSSIQFCTCLPSPCSCQMGAFLGVFASSQNGTISVQTPNLPSCGQSADVCFTIGQPNPSPPPAGISYNCCAYVTCG